MKEGEREGEEQIKTIKRQTECLVVPSRRGNKDMIVFVVLTTDVEVEAEVKIDDDSGDVTSSGEMKMSISLDGSFGLTTVPSLHHEMGEGTGDGTETAGRTFLSIHRYCTKSIQIYLPLSPAHCTLHTATTADTAPTLSRLQQMLGRDGAPAETHMQATGVLTNICMKSRSAILKRCQYVIVLFCNQEEYLTLFLSTSNYFFVSFLCLLRGPLWTKIEEKGVGQESRWINGEDIKLSLAPLSFVSVSTGFNGEKKGRGNGCRRDGRDITTVRWQPECHSIAIDNNPRPGSCARFPFHYIVTVVASIPRCSRRSNADASAIVRININRSE